MIVEAEKYEGAYLASLEKKFEDGEKIGIQKGIQKGEKAASLRIAKNLLKQGLKVQEIQKITGLSKQEIESLHA